MKKMYSSIYQNDKMVQSDRENYDFGEILEAAEQGSICAISAVEEFSEYLSVALTNMINILNVNMVILGYDNQFNNTILETTLQTKINEKALISPNRNVIVKKSIFQGDAPLYGAMAVVTNKIFEGEIEI